MLGARGPAPSPRLRRRLLPHVPRIPRRGAPGVLLAGPPEASAGSVTVLLDEKGKQLTSMEFAKILETWRDGGKRECRFLIGGADGFDDVQRDEADLLIAFGKATWPHLMARAMLAEQLWRATSIIAGHPYHREG